MRAVFFGTPQVAVPSLDALTEVAEVVGVVCQPDRPQGRGLRLQEPPVKARAKELGLEVYQPQKVRDGQLAGWLRAKQPDLALVIAYGRILPGDVLSAPHLGCLNLHASILPELRGAAPIQWALIQGKTETGVSLMQMDLGLDTGPVFAQERLPIQPKENAGELTPRIAELAREVTLRHLPQVAAGALRAVPQDDTQATYAPLVTPELCRLDFSRSATSIANLVRGVAPRPGAFTIFDGRRFKILACEAAPCPAPLEPGELRVVAPNQLLVGCGEGEALSITRLQAEGKTAMSAEEVLRGRGLRDGMRAEAVDKVD